MSITTLITKLGEILREIGGIAAAAELGQDHVSRPCQAPCGPSIAAPCEASPGTDAGAGTSDAGRRPPLAC